MSNASDYTAVVALTKATRAAVESLPVPSMSDFARPELLRQIVNAELALSRSFTRELLLKFHVASSATTDQWKALRASIGHPPDLQGADLSNQWFIDADLSGADLRGANLSGMTGFNLKLDGANLAGANISGAEWGGMVSLKGASLRGVDCSGSHLSGVTLMGDWREVRLVNATLITRFPEEHPNFEGADFTGCTLGGASPEAEAKLRSFLTPDQVAQAKQGSAGKKSSCFIATAACGTDQAPDVVRLRAFRDTFLLERPWGRRFIGFYDWASPPVARLIRRSLVARSIVRWTIVRACRATADQVLRRHRGP